MSQADNEFGQRVLKELNWTFPNPSSQTVFLCDSCKQLVWSPGFELCYNISNLEDKSKACNFCALLLQCLLDNKENPRIGKLIRDKSTLRVENSQTPLISIYNDLLSGSKISSHAQLGFPQLPKPGSEAQLTLLRKWLENCDESHECKSVKSEPNNSRMPRRLLDVGSEADPTLRLVTTGEIRTRYIALSHCWGNVPKELSFCTYQNNIHERMGGISFANLPRTFQDAVKVTRGLGIKYLWIDSICIIQEDLEDWGAHAGGMENIFSSAYCTLAASSAISQLDGFLHRRNDRPCMVVRNDGSTLYFCRCIDNFHRDVEEAALNKRGWVLQERVLSRRTIHFTSNQIYWECGEGVYCETLARLHNSKAEFLGDPDFPNYALRYFREGRIVLFQTLYKMYSRLAFTKSTDRSVGIIGLERRLARTFRTDGDYGILSCYLCRSLMWMREGPNQLTRIEYPTDRTVPSWSWMAYNGPISYVTAPFGKVYWNKNDFRITFKSGRLRDETQARAGELDPEIEALAKDINMGEYESDIARQIVFDEGNIHDLSTLRCVVFGTDKEGDQDQQKHYVMFIKPCPIEDGTNVYIRVGVGSLLGRYISATSGEPIRIR